MNPGYPSRREPVLSNPLAASWEKLRALSSRPGETPAAAPAREAVRSEPGRPSGPERIEPAGLHGEAPRPLHATGFQPQPDPSLEPGAEPRDGSLRSRPAPQAERPRRSSTEETLALLQAAIEREVLEQLKPVVQAAARDAALRAASLAEAEILQRAAPAVREAVARELARFTRR